MLRNYVNEHQNDWDRYSTAVTYSNNCHVHRSTNTTPFNLVLSRPPPELSLHHSVKLRAPPTAEQKNNYAKRLDDVKPESPALGPFRVLKTDERTVVIQRNQDVERINADRITYPPPPENAPPPEAFAPISNDIDKNTEGPT